MIFSIAAAFKAHVKAESLLRWRHKSDILQPLLFFVLVLSLFPIAINAPSQELARLAPGILWVIVLLASLFSAEHLFRDDLGDGSLSAQLLSVQPLSVYVVAKLSVHVAFVVVPLALASPIMALMLHMPGSGVPVLILSVLIGGVSLSMIAAFGAALTVSVHQRSMLLALITLPLYVPVLIFASSAIQSNIDGTFPTMQLLILMSFALLSAALLPWAISAALKLSVENK
ncbi:MAG: heme exporter protein CcmB [Pseudomonadota bacterium]